jgi:hypothetical protein
VHIGLEFEPHVQQERGRIQQQLRAVCECDSNPRTGLGQCNYVELIDTIFTDVEGVD